MVPNQPHPALLFIPDISGFTQFVNETEILHSQHIVQELLEILIDSNQLKLEVCEVEGDAIFFYRLGDKPDMQSLLNQVEKMFTRFHEHLKLYEHQRICSCGACKTAVQLSLKIVAHFGEVTGIAVKDHKKLFGKDVILIHRLLKNHLDQKEYVLFTDPVIQNPHDAVQLPDWYHPIAGVEEYDLGAVKFSVSDLSPLHNKMSINLPRYKASLKTYVAFAEEEVIRHPMEKIFEAILTMQQNSRLIEGTKKLEKMTSDSIARLGTKHYCLITRNNNVNVTESVKIEHDNIELVEMSVKGIAGYRYILKKISDTETMLVLQMLIKNNPFFKIAFAIAIKQKMIRRFKEFFRNLREYLRHTASQPATV